MKVAGVARSVGASPHEMKGGGFDARSGHISRLWVGSPVGAHVGATDRCFSLTLMFLSLPLPSPLSISLSFPFSLPQSNEKMSSGEDKKR